MCACFIGSSLLLGKLVVCGLSLRILWNPVLRVSVGRPKSANRYDSYPCKREENCPFTGFFSEPTELMKILGRLRAKWSELLWLVSCHLENVPSRECVILHQLEGVSQTDKPPRVNSGTVVEFSTGLAVFSRSVRLARFLGSILARA